MILDNIICTFKNKTSFVKLEVMVECSYYLEAIKKNGDLIM